MLLLAAYRMCIEAGEQTRLYTLQSAGVADFPVLKETGLCFKNVLRMVVIVVCLVPLYT